MKKRGLPILLCACMALALLLPAFALTARAAGTHEIGDVWALLDAIDDFESGDTIQLADNISIPGNNFVSEFDGKDVTFNLNGHTMNIGGIAVDDGGSINVTGGVMTVNSYLTADGGSVIAPSGGAQLNVNGQVCATGAGSSLTVNSVINNSYAVLAEDGGTVTVNGDITVDTSYSGVYGVSAEGSGGSQVFVNGNIVVNGNSCHGVYMNGAGSGAEITINGSVTVSGAYSIGIDTAYSTSTTVSVTGDVSAVGRGVSVNSGSGNTVTVGGSVTASGDGGVGTAIGFGSGHSITVTGNVTASGVNSNGAQISASGDSAITVDGSVTATGDGAYVAGGGTIAVGENISSGDCGASISGGGTVAVGGDVSAAVCGAYITNGGTVEVAGDIVVSVPSDMYTYSGAEISSGGTVKVCGDLSIAGGSRVRGAYISGGGTVEVNGILSANSSGYGALGADIYNGGMVKAGNIYAVGVSYYSVTGVSTSGSGDWTVQAGNVLAAGGSSLGVAASGSGTAKLGAITADTYIKTSNPYAKTFSLGGGTLNSGYFEYLDAGTTVQVKAWSLVVDHSSGGAAGIGGNTVTSGSYEAGAQISLVADDEAGYDFDEWTSTAGGSFDDDESASATFTMPAANTTVTAQFLEADMYNIIPSGITGGSVTASPSPAEKADVVTLTVTPDAGKMYKTGTLKYNDGVDHLLTLTGNTATFTMPDGHVTVSAEFVDIIVPTVTTTTLPVGTETVGYSQQLAHGSNAPAEWSVTLGSLPGGLSLSTAGVISGTPTTAGTYTFTVQAANGGGSDAQELTIVIAPDEPVIISEALPAATEDAEYYFQLEATGVDGIYWYVSGGSLPDGLGLDWTGVIYGTPAVEISEDTNYNFTVSAENDWFFYPPVSDTKEFTLTVHPAPEYALTLDAGDHGVITTGVSGNHEENAEISITATPEAGYVFSEWTSSAGGCFDDETSPSTTFTMPGNATTVAASYVRGYEVSISVMDGGSVTASPELAAAGATVTLTVTPALGKQLQVGSLQYSYGGMDYPLTVAENTATLNMPAADVTVSAVFEEKPAIEVEDASTLSAVLDSFVDGDTIKLMASFTYNDPIEIDGMTVTFNTNGYTLLVETPFDTPLTVANGGSVLLKGAGELSVKGGYFGVYADNDGSATVSNAEANGDYGFAVYAEDGATVTVNGDVMADGDHSVGVGSAGSTVTVGNAIAAPTPIRLYDYYWVETDFDIGEGVLNAGTGYFEYVTEDETANVRVRGWDLTVAAGTGGSITTGASGKFEAGTVIPVSAAASNGYSFGGWSSTNGGSFADAAGISTSFTMPASAATITANFTYLGGGGYDPEPTEEPEPPIQPKTVVSDHVATDDDTRLEQQLREADQPTITLTENQAGFSSGALAALSAADVPLTLRGEEIALQLPPNWLQLPEDDDAVVQIAAEQLTEEQQVARLENAALDSSTGIFEVCGKIFDLSVLVHRDDTTEELHQFGQPIAVTVDLSELGELTAEQVAQLTAVRLEVDAAGKLVPVALGGTYDPVTKTFTFSTDRFSLYSVMYLRQPERTITLSVGSQIILVNGEERTTDVAPQIENGRTLVPLRFIAETLGAEVSWNEADKVVVIVLDGVHIDLPIGYVNPSVGLDVPAQLVNGRTLVPLRYIAENLGAIVNWYEASGQVKIIQY